MNQNDSAKNQRKPRKNVSIDGILHPAGNGKEQNISFRRSNSYQPTRVSIDDFSRPEGYQPAKQTPLSPVSGPISRAEAFELPPQKNRWGQRRRRHGAKITGWRLYLRRSALGLLATLVLTGGFLFAKGYLKARQIFKGGSEGAAALDVNVDPSRLKAEGDGRVNILVLGKGGAGHTAPDLTDTILLVSIDPLHKEAGLVSIPRDLYVKVPSNGSMKINSVYVTAKNAVLRSGRQTTEQKAKAEKAGLESIEQTVEETLGIPIHYYTMVDFEGFKKAIDTVGGIDIDVKTPVHEVMRIDGRQYTLNVKQGRQHFDGFRALAYARSRLTSPRGDFDRAERQRLILVALKEKILSIGTFANPLKLSQLIDAFGDHMQTNLSVNEMLRLYELGKQLPSDKVASIGLADPPNNFVKTGLVGGQSVVMPVKGIGNFSEIQSYIRNTLKDSFIRRENAQITILNGTTNKGAAAKKAEELKSYGYNVGLVSDAPTKTYKSNILVDLRGDPKKYTKHYLQKRLKTSATGKLPDGAINPGTADFVIIIGSE